jgi:phage shock protein A
MAELTQQKERKQVDPQQILSRKIQRAEENISKITARVSDVTGSEKERLESLLELHINYKNSLV